MKKTFLSLAIAALAIGCTNDFVDSAALDGASAKTIGVNVSASDSSSSRVNVSEGTTGWDVTWNELDQLGAWSTTASESAQSCFKIEDGDYDAVSSKFTGTTTYDEIRLLHPYNESLTKSNGIVSLYLSNQTVGSDFSHLGATTYMISDPVDVSTSGSSDLTVGMTHLGAAIELKMKFSGDVTESDYTLTDVFLRSDDCKLYNGGDLNIATGEFDPQTYGDITIETSDIEVDSDGIYTVRFSSFPFTIEAGESITVSAFFTGVNDEKEYVAEATLTNSSEDAVKFERATINTINATFAQINESVSDSTTSQTYDVYLLIGQSNMAGRGTMLAEDLITPLDNVFLLNDDGGISEAISPLNQYSTVRKDLSTQQINPGNGFGPLMEEYTGRNILLVVNARGGTSISEWQKGSYAESSGVYYYLYADAVERCKLGMQYGELKAILWHQGEANSSSPSSYISNLSTMVANLRADIGMPDVPFIAGEIAPWHSNREKFNPIIATIADNISNSAYVRTYGLTPLIDADDPHFSRDAQFILGQRYGAKVIEMVYGQSVTGTASTDLTDDSVSFTAEGGSTTFTVSSSLDLSTIKCYSQWADYWCTVEGNEQGEVTITTVANTGISRESTVFIELYDGFVPIVLEVAVSQEATDGTIELGTLIYDDPDDPTKATGIVCYITDDATQAMALSLEIADVVWANIPSTDTDIALPDLYSELKGAWEADEALTYLKSFGYYGDGYYPAFEWAESLGDGWYIPTREDWEDYLLPAFAGTADSSGEYDLVTELNNIMVAAGGTSYSMGDVDGVRYWSCNLKDADAASNVRIARPYKGDTTNVKKSSGTPVARAVKYIDLE